MRPYLVDIITHGLDGWNTIFFTLFVLIVKVIVVDDYSVMTNSEIFKLKL